MDQDRFDSLTRALVIGRSRRSVLGALAAVGAGLASLSGTAAQGKKGKKGKKGKVGAEFTCTAANANEPGLGGCSDNDACCASTAGGLGPICITRGTQESGTQRFCGKLNNSGPGNQGSGVCRICPTGTICSRDADNEIRCICTPGTCPNGCCINNDLDDLDDECVQNGSAAPVNSVNPNFDGNFVCGFGGSECTICSVGTIFAGCCTATGACSGGTTGGNCGGGGALCQQCPAGVSCGIDQTCEGIPPCGPQTCGAGCCSGEACLSGTSNTACGEGGGACAACPTGEACINHQCQIPPCDPGLTRCSGVCTSTLTDPNNCGVCGNVCASGVCQGGACKQKMMMMMMMMN